MDNTINPSHSSSHSSSSSITTTNSAATTTTNSAATTTNRDQFLRHLNKLSHKITKPTTTKPTIEPPLIHPPVHPPVQQQQPPVYNINKSDFRDVVQKLTGSPAHATTPPPPIHTPKPASSRLQRIRPPPLAQLTTRPPNLLSCAGTPLSPLPPLPTCHAAAESPISAYMRFLHNSISAVDLRTAQIPPPVSNAMFSPTGNGSLGFPQLPLSPVPGVPSPKWRDL